MNISQNHVFFALFGILLTLVYWAAVRTYGMGITFDSVQYLYAAQNLPEKLIKADGTPFVEWPPLYPIFLYLGTLVNIDVLTWTTYFHFVLFLTNGTLAAFLLHKLAINRLLFGIALALIAFSVPILLVHIFVWSEPLFITFLLLTIIFLDKYLREAKIHHLLSLIILAILLILQRKSGIMFVPGIALILLLNTKATVSLRWFSSIVVFLAGLSTYLIWSHIRSKYLGQLPTSTLSISDFLDKLTLSMHIISTWFMPHQIPFLIRIILLFIGGITALKLLSFTTIKKHLINLRLPGILLVLFSCYLVLLIVSLSIIQITDDIDDRIMSPIYLPGIMLFACLFDKLYKKAAELDHPKKILKSALLIILFVWMMYPVLRTAHNIMEFNSRGTGGFNSIYWKENQIINYLLRTNLTTPVLSNYSLPLHYYLNMKNNQEVEILHQKPESAFIYVNFAERESTLPEIDHNRINTLFESKEGKVLYIIP
ncbi:MAG: hypothetical protein ACK4ND_10395 [Cytophagaceae bacterium]